MCSRRGVFMVWPRAFLLPDTVCSGALSPMKIRMVQNCLALGRHRGAGSVQDLPEAVANQLVVMGRAKHFGLESKTADPVVETRDPLVASKQAAPLPKMRKRR